MKLLNDSILVPIGMVQFALKFKVIKPVNSFLATKFYTNGSSYGIANLYKSLCPILGVSQSALYSYFSYLLEWDWVGKNENSGVYFFRSIDRIIELEQWGFKRSVVMTADDLKTPKAFMVSALIASAIKTGRQRKESGRNTSRSLSNSFPVSHNFLQSSINIKRTASKHYRNQAIDCGYLKVSTNLKLIHDLTPYERDVLKSQGYASFPMLIQGNESTVHYPLNRVRYHEGELYVQFPSIISTRLKIKSRKKR